MSPLRVGIVGAGAWANRYHIPVLRRLAERGEVSIVGIWSRTTAHAVSTAREAGIDRVFDRIDDLLDIVDGVSVVVSKSVVAQLLERVARHGVAFITEKPPGNSFQEVKRLAKVVTVPHVVGFNRRYQPLSRSVKELLPNLAPAKFVECTLTRTARNDPHFVTETGIHCLDLLQYWFGPIRTVDTVRWHAGGSPAWLTRLSFENGTQGIVKLFPFGGANAERYEIHTERESVAIRTHQHHAPEEPNEVALYGSGKSRYPGTTEVPVGGSGDPLAELGFLAEYEDLVRVIRTNESRGALSSLSSCLDTLRIAEQIEAQRP